MTLDSSYENMVRHSNDECKNVFAIHGFSSNSLWIQPLCWRMKRLGYSVENWGYASMWQSIEVHAIRLRKHFVELSQKMGSFHIVAHSMGSILVRQALTGDHLDCVKRIVFLAPPNRGSPVATAAGNALGLRYLFPPLKDLSIDNASFVNSIVDSRFYEVGVIAARFDALVPTSRTHLSFEADHVVLNATHNSLLFSARAARCVECFFTHGRFLH